ncbi:hypothetical protein OJAV_G00003510 [Oryzias javanicus]|uniref:Mesothelin-like protein n=1 Tax=Oryzias javanicus TaxID=123683 RepID=A0A437DMG8_ORYJA|nr:hypothetical protein OJAV_G00003510 [Oryzias javanicus]
MTPSRQESVYTQFIKIYLSRKDTADPGCTSNIKSSTEWLKKNVGGFSVLLSIQNIQELYPQFSGVEALSLLSVTQLAEVAAAPGQLTTAEQVTTVMTFVPDQQFASFFDNFSPKILGRENVLPSTVRSAMLQVVFNRANLSSPSVSDSVVLLWLQVRLRPLLVNLVPDHVTPYFNILAGRSCSTEKQGVTFLNSTISTLSDATKTKIQDQIALTLKGTSPLRCYGDSYSISFYSFLKSSFMGFQFPDLTTFLSLMPQDRKQQLINSMPPSDLGDFLRQTNVVGAESQLCQLYSSYLQIPLFLETESLPEPVRQRTLPCVWPMALRSSSRSEVNAWFDRGLPNYLVFLTKTQISQITSVNASCLAFQKIVSALGSYDYSVSDFTSQDVYNTIKVYLSSATAPKCYDSNNPELNSTAWFADQPKVTLTLISYYTQLVYQQVSNFNPLLLPSVSQCYAPGPVFTQLNANDSMKVLETLNRVCDSLDEQISAALTSNFGNKIDSSLITAIGNGASSFSMGQIKTISSSQLITSLSTLSTVTGWREGQAKVIVQSLLSSGEMKIDSSSSLSQLGSLVIGLPSNTFSSIISSELITASKIPSFVTNIMSAPQILQQNFVYQVELFFDIIASDSSTTMLGGPDNLSSSVLQGFTCTGVTQFSRTQVTKLVKACRRKGSRKVALMETQLTCMYNYISKFESDVTSFALYPPDMLLYYDYSLVPQSSCRSYFQELGDADFSVFSSVLSYKRTALFNNARRCMGITSTSLTADHVSVLGNMCCMLDGSYIQNSDPSILEKLKNCPDLTTDSQGTAIATLLISGNTQYGQTTTWNEATLTNLDMLTLYLPTTFYDYFGRNTKKAFLKSFLKDLKAGGVSRNKRRRLKSVIRQSIKNRSKRTTDCTVGIITQVTISDSTFPLDYDVVQFNNCLSNVTVKDNFDAITEKVDEVDYLKIVLQKLGEAYNFIIPEDQVQVLGFASRVATVDDISSWTITQADTLAALMDSSNGDWDPSLAKEIISKYLAVEGNSLGRAELNAIKGPNLCTLDLNVIQKITAQTLKEAEALNITNCTPEAKKALFNVASQSFRAVTRASPSFLLLKSFLGGASVDYIRGLVPSNISMDLETFSNLDPNVVLNLTVTEVKGLLGTNLPDLKSYENQTLVQTWIRSQYQSELNTLGLNLSGGRADPVTTATNSTTAAAATTMTTTTTTAGSGSGGSTTTGSGVRIQADAGFSFLVILAILVISQFFTI